MVISMPVAIGDVTDAVLAEGGGSECVSAVAVDLRRDAAPESERGEGVVVCEEDHGVDQLGEGPAVLLCFQEALEKGKGVIYPIRHDTSTKPTLFQLKVIQLQKYSGLHP